LAPPLQNQSLLDDHDPTHDPQYRGGRDTLGRLAILSALAGKTLPIREGSTALTKQQLAFAHERKPGRAFEGFSVEQVSQMTL
jgi:hypothetical protein